MNDPKDGGTAPSQAYAAALRNAVAGYTATGGTQRAIAEATHVSPAALSRYLSGDRLAPPSFPRSLQSFLAGQDHPLDPPALARLEGLCRAAHAASGAPAAQLVQLHYDLARLTEEHGRAQQIAEARLAGLEAQAGHLAQQLAQALNRVEAQDESLRHAQDYTHQIEAELAEQHKQARELRREVEVLREQNRLLVEEQAGTVPGVSTQAGLGAEAVSAAAGGTNAPLKEAMDLPAPQNWHYSSDPPDRDPFHPDPPNTGAANPGSLTFDPPRWTPSGLSTPPPNRGIADPVGQQPVGPSYGRGVLWVALMTYLSWVLWLTCGFALVADPGPSIVLMAVTAAVALAGPHFGLLVLIALSGQGAIEKHMDKLFKALFTAQGVSFAAWMATLMGPVFKIVAADTVAEWIATTILL
ncbi:hypothetical protein [Streptomyces cyaneofuscatus]|uniref:hypothetical protein n=1 Tax=Streptomyces cyaneofuscatus TaxID=66883 RepID=UPI003661205F